jgi:hypothetical protein
MSCLLSTQVCLLTCCQTPHTNQYNPDTLTLVPLAKLEKYIAEIKAQTAQASGLLTHLLQSRDTLQQDSEMFNKLIGDLVVEAQKRTTGSKGGRSTPQRKGTAG